MRTLAFLSCLVVLVGCGDDVDNDPGGGVVCEPFFEEPAGSEVRVRLSNQTAAAIYLGDEQETCSTHIPFEVLADGQSLAWRGGNCGVRCKDATQGPIGCTAECAAPEATRIEPGASVDVVWKGTVLVSEQMPAACYDSGEVGDACMVEEDAPADLTLRAYAWTEIACQGGEPACTCTPDASGVCTVSFATVTGTDLVASASLAVVSDTTVELVFSDPAQ